MKFHFDAKTNLEYRIDNVKNQSEYFEYDALNRLKTWTPMNGKFGGPTISIDYNALGNITKKDDLGNYTFAYGEGNGKPHALTSISGVPTSFPTANLIVTYTDFKKIATLHEGSKDYVLTYGVDDQRRKSEYYANGLSQGTPTLTHYYLGGYEEQVNSLGNVRKIHYLSGGALYIQNNGSDSLLYAYADFQGSLLALTDAAGNIVEKYAYDPWGARRNPNDWTQKDTRTNWITNRGYTGHEHIDQFGIINMNGRVYDPATAMFMSPDPNIQALGNWLNYNRYGYCMSNPFRYTDPSGEFWNIIIGAFIGGVVNWVTHGCEFSLKGLGYFGVGAAVGALSAVGGAALAATFKAAGVFAGALTGAVTGMFTGGASSYLLNGGNNLINGDKFNKNWQTSVLSGALSGTLSGAISGGIKGFKYAKSQGANPWTGEVNGSERAYQATIKTGVAPQQDPSKHCYSVADEYADKGHGNLSITDFQNAAAAKNNGVIPDGADPGIVAKDAGIKNVGVINGGTEYDDLGRGIQSGKMEAIATIGSDINAGHSVNVVSFKVADRLNWFGGGTTPFLKMNTVSVWDPLSATVRRLTEGILKLEFIRF